MDDFHGTFVYNIDIMKIRDLNLETKHTHVCGIVNVTPDSFSDGGKYNSIDDVLYTVEDMIDAGAAMIDIGGESTRPGATPISAEEEIERVVPVITELRKRFDICMSLDTYHASSALAGLDAGIDIVNDVYGMSDEMASAIRERNAYYIYTFNGDLPCEDFTENMKTLRSFVNRLDDYGIDKSRVIFDPGIGFNKTKENDLSFMANLASFKEFDMPVMLGASRKSSINYILNLPVDQRLEGTLATTAAAVYSGTEIVRVHDVRANVRFVTMLEAILDRG